MAAHKLTERQVQNTLEAYENAGNNSAKAARAMGIPSSTFRERMKAIRNIHKIKATKETKKQSSKRSGLSRKEFKAEFDIDTKIRRAIRKAVKGLGNDCIVKDSDFRSVDCGISGGSAWRQVAEEEEFLKYQFTCDGKIWWASPSTIKWACEDVSKARIV